MADDFYQISIDTPDFSGITMPEVTTIDYAKLMGELTPAALAASEAGVSSALRLANAQGDANAAKLQRVLDTSVAQTKSAYVSLSDAMLNQNMAAMDAVSPGWRELLASSSEVAGTNAKVISANLAANLPTMLSQGADIAKQQGDLVSSLLKGEIPKDVSDRVTRQAAEKAGAFGLFGDAEGGAKRKLEMRDLGMTSLQASVLGSELGKDTAGLWSSAALNAAAMATAAQTPIAAFIDMQDKLGLKPNVSVENLFKETYEANRAATVVSPDQVFSGAMSEYNAALGWGVDVSRGNQVAQAEYDSMKLQFETDKLNAKTAVYGAELAANTSLWAAQLDARTTENAAAVNANAMMEAAYTNAKANVDVANIGAKSAFKVATINKGTWDNKPIYGEATYTAPIGALGGVRTYNRKVITGYSKSFSAAG